MRIVLLALTAFLLAPPTHAQTDGDDPFLQGVRTAAGMTAGQRAGPRGDQIVDKVLSLGRDPQRGMIITGIQALAPGASNDRIQIADHTVALLRTRAATPDGNRAPDPDDLAFVRRTGMRLFIAGEWSTPPVLWEIERESGVVRLRTIDAEGRPGAWREPAG